MLKHDGTHFFTSNIETYIIYDSPFPSANFQNLQPSSNYKYPKISKQSKQKHVLKVVWCFFFETKNKPLFRSLYIKLHGNRHLN